MTLSIDRRRALIDRLHGVLLDTVEKEEHRSDLVHTPDGQELEWFGCVREALHEEIKAIRAELGLPAADLTAEVLQADQLASGHIDWQSKFPLYCVEIALGENFRR